MNNAGTGSESALTIFTGLVAELNPADLPQGSAAICCDMDFSVGSVKTRAGIENVFVYEGADEENLTGLGLDVTVLDAEPWSDPDNITLNSPPSYASVTLNEAGSAFGFYTSGSMSAAANSSDPTFSPGSPVAAGDVGFIQTVNYSNSGGPQSTTGITSALGNVPVLVKRLAFASALFPPTAYMEIWAVPITVSGSETFTFTFSGTVDENDGFYYEFFGLQTAGLDGTPQTVSGENNVPDVTFPTLTTSEANDVLLCFTRAEDTSFLTPAGYQVSPAFAFPTQVFYQQVSSAGAQDLTVAFDSENTDNYAGIFLGWKASPASGGPGFSDILRANTFGLTSPLTSSVLGLELQISGNQSETATVLAVKPTTGGESQTFALPGTDGTVTLGGPGEFFGLSGVTSAQVNNPGFGFDITAADASGNESTVSISAVELKIWFTPPDVQNFDWVKTFAMQNESLFTLAIDNTGVLWQEDAINDPGVLAPIYTALEPDSFAQSVTYDDREWIALSDLVNGTDMPRQYNGQWVDRVSQVGPAAPPSFTATAVTYDIATITQPDSVVITGMMWSSSPGVHTPGNTITFWQQVGGPPPPASFVANLMVGSVVNIQGLPDVNGNDPNGVYLIASLQNVKGIESGDGTLFYTFSVTAAATTFGEVFNHASMGIGNYQITLATLTTTTAVPNVQVGSQISIAGASVPAWDETWTVLYTPNAAQLTITSTSLSADVATYEYTLISGTAPTVGEQVTVVGSTNGNGIFNVVNGQITSVAPNQFSLALLSPDIAPAAEGNAQAIVNGTIFQFDPGLNFVGTDGTGGNDPIFGDSTGGTLTQPGNLGEGTRQAVVFFMTRNAAITGCSPPATFTLNEGANAIVASNIPLGPPDTVARGIAFTGAGGAFFFYIPQPVTVTSNGQKLTYTSTIVNDNISSEATFTFTDAVLLAATSIDIQGNNLFEQIELGSCLGFVAYANRLFAWGEQNKIQNLINLSFDGGYLAVPMGTLPQPLGWTIDPAFGGNGNLQVSPLFGDAYYIQNATGSTISGPTGMITQTAFQDYLQQPIVNINTQYGVRVTASCPGGVNGNGAALDVDLFSPSLNRTYGIFSVPLTSMSADMQIFTGNLLTSEFFSSVPSDLLLRVYASDLLDTADVLIDRLEPFDLSQPVLTTQLRGSYEDNFEAFDDVTGNLGVGVENQQEVRNAFELFDNLYVVKTQSFVETTDNGVTEPDGWTVHEVSNKVGTPSIHGVDVGEGWALIAGEAGLYLFEGGKPQKISPEIDPLWAMVPWTYGYTLWIRNDTNNRRILIGVPLPTPNQWMPQFPVNLNPTQPNVVLSCSYKELMTASALASEGAIRQGYTGQLRSFQFGRRWSVWSIEAAYADFITRADTTQPVFFCGDTNTAKIYQQITGNYFDDGEAMPWRYTTYPFLQSQEAQQIHAGLHNLLATYGSALLIGEGNVDITILPDTLGTPYGDALLPLPLANPPAYGDTEFPLNDVGNRFFVDFQPHEAGDWMELSRVVLTVRANPWAPVRGGNNY